MVNAIYSMLIVQYIIADILKNLNKIDSLLSILSCSNYNLF